MLLAACFAALGAYGVARLLKEYPSSWASTLPVVASSASEGPESDLGKALTASGDSSGPVYGAVLPLARFVQSNGQAIEVLMIEGTFHDRTIEPADVWGRLGESVMLLSSVDERRTGAGGLSGPISKGCSIAPVTVDQQLGTATISPCEGDYSAGGRVQWVGSLAIIVEKPVGAATEPCWAQYGIVVDETGYQSCVSNAVAQALRSFFNAMRKQPQTADAMVVPFLGTGAGKLSKAAFLERFLSDVLIEELGAATPLPRRIYLQVQRWDGQGLNRWPETRVALVSAVTKAVANWNRKEHKPADSEWLSLTGVALGSAALLLLAAFNRPMRTVTALGSLLARPTLMTVFAWCSVAIGCASLFKAVWTFFPAETNPFLQVGAGFVAAFFCGPLLMAIRSVESTLKPEAPPALAPSPPTPVVAKEI